MAPVRQERTELSPLFNPSRRQGASTYGKRGGRGRRLRSRIPQRRCRGTTTSIRVFDGGKCVRVFIPKGAVRAALSVYGMGSGNLGARGGAVGVNSDAHFGLPGTIDFTASGRGTCAGGTRRGGPNRCSLRARRDHRIRRTPLEILLGLRMGRFGLHFPTTPSVRARTRVGHECSDLDRRNRLGNDGLSRLVVRHQGRSAGQTERS